MDKKIRHKLCQTSQIREILFTVHKHALRYDSLKGYGKFLSILSHIFVIYTNLFLTLIPVNTVGKIVDKRAEDKHQ